MRHPAARVLVCAGFGADEVLPESGSSLDGFGFASHFGLGVRLSPKEVGPVLDIGHGSAPVS
jgi:hypothetical protein